MTAMLSGCFLALGSLIVAFVSEYTQTPITLAGTQIQNEGAVLFGLTITLIIVLAYLVHMNIFVHVYSILMVVAIVPSSSFLLFLFLFP